MRRLFWRATAPGPGVRIVWLSSPLERDVSRLNWTLVPIYAAQPRCGAESKPPRRAACSCRGASSRRAALARLRRSPARCPHRSRPPTKAATPPIGATRRSTRPKPSPPPIRYRICREAPARWPRGQREAQAAGAASLELQPITAQSQQSLALADHSPSPRNCKRPSAVEPAAWPRMQSRRAAVEQLAQLLEPG
jgi:hypothetical protein